MLSADAEFPPLVPPAISRERLEEASLAERVQRGDLRLVRPGVYTPPWDDAGQPYRAAILSEVRGILERCTADLTFSHSTAALLHGAWTYRVPQLVHLTQRTNQHVRSDVESLVRRHHTNLAEHDRTTIDRTPVTTLARTLVDCIRTLSRTSALVTADSLFRLGADPWDVERIMSRSKGKRGIVQARQVLELCDPRSGSPGETVARLAAIDAGLPRPECQTEVATSHGPYFVDLGWEEVRVAVEFDGEVKYSGGEFGDPTEVRRAEAARQTALEAAGWTVLRVRWPDLDDSLALEAQVREAYLCGLRRRAPATHAR
jgi:hypothetical protein